MREGNSHGGDWLLACCLPPALAEKVIAGLEHAGIPIQRRDPTETSLPPEVRGPGDVCLWVPTDKHAQARRIMVAATRRRPSINRRLAIVLVLVAITWLLLLLIRHRF